MTYWDRQIVSTPGFKKEKPLMNTEITWIWQEIEEKIH